ncbi:MAG: hypothetical protein PVSMB7_08820 [Chloroflexota bacterium]
MRYLEAHRGKATYLFATTNAGTAEPYIISTGEPVMATGGFTGSDPILTPAKLATLVRHGTIRYFVLGGGGFGGAGNVSSWVQQNCRSVSASTYTQHAVAATAGRFGGGQQLYDCAVAK